MTDFAADNAFVWAMDEQGAAEYSDVRPGYPAAAVDALLARAPRRSPLVAADVGAGTGKFTRALLQRGVEVTAIDPSPAMRVELTRTLPVPVRVRDATAEATGLSGSSVDLVTWAQCFHWLDQAAATAEAARILRPDGIAAAIWNQMDVEEPWVHRLTRIMRSGDVRRRDKGPDFGPGFEVADLIEVGWTDKVTTQSLFALARTRSSYLKSSEQVRRRMQENLRWYLYDHLGFAPGSVVDLPYTTFVWVAKVR